MASKKIDIKFDLDSKSVKIAGEETMRLAQQVRLLKNELATGNYSQEEFDILSNKLDNVQEKMGAASARSGDLLTSLQLIPGPIGDIAAKFNGAISLLQQFSKFSFADLQTQFKKTIDDVRDIGKSLLTNTGISAAYDLVNRKLAAGFVAVGVGEQAAAVGARAFALALAATGIGLLVVALGSAVSMLMDFVEGSDDAAKAQERLGKEIANVNTLLDMDLADAARRQKIRIAQMKRDGKSEKDIRDQSLSDLKENLKLTEQALQKNRELESKVIKTGEGELKDVYAQQATLEEKQAQLIADIREREINNETETNKERETQRQKNLQAQQKANAEREKNEQETQRKLAEAAAIQLEAELSLLDPQEREIRERTTRFTNELVKLKQAGYTDFTNLEEEFRLDVNAIDDKYKKERLEKQKAIQQKERELLFVGLQDQIDAIDKANELFDTDFQEDNIRLEQKRTLLQQQRDLELQSVENDEVKRLEIIKKYADAESEIDREVTENKKAELLARQTAQIQFAQALGSAFGALSGLLKQGTAAAKAAALAEIAIGTGVGFINALDIAQKSAKGLGPGAAFAFPIFYATQVAAVLSAASRAKAILKSGSGGSGGGNSPESSSAPAATSAPAPIQVTARRNQGGFVFGDGGSITDSIPAMLSNGEFVMNAKSSSMFSPMLTAMNNMGNLPNTAIPQSLGNQSLVDVMSQGVNNRPIKTYVTAQDMSNQQQFDRTIKSRSLI